MGGRGILEKPLGLILSEFDYQEKVTSDIAIGCRLLACCIDRLKEAE